MTTYTKQESSPQHRIICRLHSTREQQKLGSLRRPNSQLGAGRGGTPPRSNPPHLLSSATTDSLRREQGKPDDHGQARPAELHDITPTARKRQHRHGSTRKRQEVPYSPGEPPAHACRHRTRPAQDYTSKDPSHHGNSRPGRKTERPKKIPRGPKEKTDKIINRMDPPINHYTVVIGTEPTTPLPESFGPGPSSDPNMDRTRTGYHVVHQITGLHSR